MNGPRARVPKEGERRMCFPTGKYNGSDYLSDPWGDDMVIEVYSDGRWVKLKNTGKSDDPVAE